LELVAIHPSSECTVALSVAVALVGEVVLTVGSTGGVTRAGMTDGTAAMVHPCLVLGCLTVIVGSGVWGVHVWQCMLGGTTFQLVNIFKSIKSIFHCGSECVGICIY